MYGLCCFDPTYGIVSNRNSKHLVSYGDSFGRFCTIYLPLEQRPNNRNYFGTDRRCYLYSYGNRYQRLHSSSFGND